VDWTYFSYSGASAAKHLLKPLNYCPARTWCTNWTAIDPSPTADATRFMLLARISPTAKIPGRLVSSKKGAPQGKFGCDVDACPNEAFGIQRKARSKPDGIWDQRRSSGTRVSPSHNGDFVVLAHLGLHLGRAIINSDTFELFNVGKIQFSITRANRDICTGVHSIHLNGAPRFFTGRGPVILARRRKAFIGELLCAWKIASILKSRAKKRMVLRWAVLHKRLPAVGHQSGFDSHCVIRV
jgi:hypothetical protein